MWQFFLAGFLWFLILFGLHFCPSSIFKRILALSCFAILIGLVGRSGVDPIVWGFFFAFSLITFLGGIYFKRWVFQRNEALTRELGYLDKKGQALHQALEVRTHDANDRSVKADNIEMLCEALRRMSQCTDMAEALFFMAHELARQEMIDSIKIITFHDDNVQFESADMFLFQKHDFSGAEQAERLLRDKKRIRCDANEWERYWAREAIKRQQPFMTSRAQLSDLTFSAVETSVRGQYYVFPHKLSHTGQWSLLLVEGTDSYNANVLTLLCEHFFAEYERIRLYERVQSLSVTDDLTQMPVRRYFMERYDDEFIRRLRLGQKISFLMIDIDHFKSINDSYGHPAGDQVIRSVAASIKKSIREVDLAGRYGGEEFSVFLVDTDDVGALYAAERIRRCVNEEAIELDGQSIRVSVSIGCASSSEILSAPVMLIEEADRALYDAKKQGRNRVILANLKKHN